MIGDELAWRKGGGGLGGFGGGADGKGLEVRLVLAVAGRESWV